MVSFSSSSILKEEFGSLLTPCFPWRFGGPTVYHLLGSSNRHTCKVIGATPAMAATSLTMLACVARIAPGPHVLITNVLSKSKLGVVRSESVRRITSFFFFLSLIYIQSTVKHSEALCLSLCLSLFIYQSLSLTRLLSFIFLFFATISFSGLFPFHAFSIFLCLALFFFLSLSLSLCLSLSLSVSLSVCLSVCLSLSLSLSLSIYLFCASSVILTILLYLSLLF